jgi:dTDP-glucose pyrophosphorylase
MTSSFINIVIPMAGASKRFANSGFSVPKPFIEINGKTMIACVLDNLAFETARFILVAQKNHLNTYSKHFNYLRENYNCEILYIDKITDGPLCTSLRAHELINNDFPLVFANCDQIIDIKLKDWLDDCANKDADGSIIIFNDENPKWSFVAINEYGEIDKVREKEVISNNATVGIYFFKKGEYFINAALDVISRAEKTNGEYYIAPAYNFLIKNNLKITPYKISIQQMHGIGTPNDLIAYINYLESKHEH